MAEEETQGPITWPVVEAAAGQYAETVQWMRDGLNHQKDLLRDARDEAANWAMRTQVAVIVLGFIASLAAVLSKGAIWPWWGAELWTLLNVMVPLLISALTAVIALFDFRGAYARGSTAYAAISAIKAEIDYHILVGHKDPKARITDKMLEDWDKRIAAAAADHERAWVRSMTERRAARP